MSDDRHMQGGRQPFTIHVAVTTPRAFSLRSPSPPVPVHIMPTKSTLSEFHSESTRIAHAALLTIVLAVGALGMWATYVPLAEGVPAAGFVTVETKRKAVQHLVGGRVQKVLVREGETVTAGQPLLELDERTADAALEASRQEYFNLLANQSRLLAERAGRQRIDFGPTLSAAAADLPQVGALLAAQRKLMTARQRALDTQLNAIDKRIEGERTKLVGYQLTAANLALDYAKVGRQIEDLRPLVRDAYAPRNQLLDLERERARVANLHTESVTNGEVCADTVRELEAQKTAVRGERRQEIETALADVVRDLTGAEARFRATSAELDANVIRAPANGQVMGLLTQTPGTIVQAGERILDVVPSGSTLVVEAHIAPHLVDRLTIGQPVELRFSAFANSPLLVAEGRLETLSTDVLVEQKHEMPYYLARVSVTPKGLKALARHELRAGLPVELVFRTGTRTTLSYLLHPLARRLSQAMTEE